MSEAEEPRIFALRTTANREDQVADFLSSNVAKKKLEVYSVIRAHGMRGYIFLEAKDKREAEEASFRVPYARGILPKEINYSEIEHMLEKSKTMKMTIKKNDIVEIISGPFKREKAKISRFDKDKEEVVIELLEAAVPIPITLNIDAVKVIRREGGLEEDSDESSQSGVGSKESGEPVGPLGKAPEKEEEPEKKEEKDLTEGPLANKK